MKKRFARPCMSRFGHLANHGAFLRTDFCSNTYRFVSFGWHVVPTTHGLIWQYIFKIRSAFTDWPVIRSFLLFAYASDRNN